MKNHALVFDCDGTLMDSLDQALESFHYTLQKMGEKPRTTAEIKSHFGVAADRIFFKVLGDATRAQEAYAIYKSYQAEIAPETKVYPGIRELLEKAQEAEVPLGLVTGRHLDDLKILLQPHGLLHYFHAVITDNELAESKPSPEGLLRAASRLGLPATQMLYVGDSISDIRAAQAAGASAVVALWDKEVDLDKVKAAHPNFIVQNPDELWNLFRTLSASM